MYYLPYFLRSYRIEENTHHFSDERLKYCEVIYNKN
nr:MAG TPA: hypothetical protein [Caudoviricetes sp.]